MSKLQTNLAVCIPTFRRTRQLAQLLDNLRRQTVAIRRLIVVDGDPANGSVLQLLGAVDFCPEAVYVPSNHANLPYQRFLGWKAAEGCEFLLYLDDDLQLRQDSVEHLLRPLCSAGTRVVGTTAEFLSARESTVSPRRERTLARWMRRIGVSRLDTPGELTPSGHRRPIRDRNRPYAVAGCLRGGAMAFRTGAITADCFHPDLFAMAQRGWGLGEDVLLSRSVGRRGLLLTSLQSGIVHPDGEGTPAFRRDAYGRGYATSYSRRLLNDHYRGGEPTRWLDRAALVRSYGAHGLTAWALAILSVNRAAFAFAFGYSRGAMRGLVQRPRTERLTPTIDWWADADSALAEARTLAPAEMAGSCPL